jgi:hypothetical protein
MNHDLEEGMSDGKYKKIAPNRGGVSENDHTYQEREDLYDLHYGIHETPKKHLPDGTIDPRSSMYVDNPASEVY